MLISRNWLQRHIEQELPSAETIAESLLLHSFEIEGVEQVGDDAVIDIDVLPNRAHDCLGHQGIAREYAAVTHIDFIPETYHYHDTITVDEHDVVPVRIENEKACLRYSARAIRNITVSDSPEWLRSYLKTLDQKTINNVVDATNFVLFDIGQPTHVFDADKVIGGITVRNAHDGETMTTLSGDNLTLRDTDLVIADEEGILALAGIKGGTKAEVTQDTKNIIIEVANFDSVTIRKTARRLKLFTDASKRFENGLSSIYVEKGMEALSMFLSDIHQSEVLGLITDIYPHPEQERTIDISLQDIQGLLGIPLTQEDVLNIFERLSFQYRTNEYWYTVIVPFERLDIVGKEDIIEEIGRLYGYHNITTQHLDDYVFTPEIHKLTYIENIIKNICVAEGYLELKSYSFVNKGEVEVLNPLASDKKALRKTLLINMEQAVEKNIYQLDFLGLDVLKIFEIGRVYTKSDEYTECVIAVHNKNKSARKKYGSEQEQLEALHKKFEDKLGTSILLHIEKGEYLVMNLNDIDVEITNYADIFDMQSYSENAHYHAISQYPYSTRDVSFWSQANIDETGYRTLIADSGVIFLKKISLFDTFEKEGKKSYAFSLVFQSDEKTLSDEDINNDMNAIILALKKVGAEIR